MACLTAFLGLIIGDLIPLGNKTWQLYIILTQIIDIIMAPSITATSSEKLKDFVSAHHSLYLQLFQESLKAKHHFLIHYPRLLENIGPLKQASCMRFEAKHQSLKNIAKSTKSRVKPAYTLAIQHQLHFNHRLITAKGFEYRLLKGKVIADKFSELQYFTEFKDIIPSDISDNNSIITSFAKVNGTNYKSGVAILIDYMDVYPIFAKILFVVIKKECEVYFICKKFITLEHSLHMHAFEVSETNTYLFICQERLDVFKSHTIHTAVNGKKYIAYMY